jgi:16S rRNA (guanine527-N7)-methyltransferase
MRAEACGDSPGPGQQRSSAAVGPPDVDARRRGAAAPGGATHTSGASDGDDAGTPGAGGHDGGLVRPPPAAVRELFGDKLGMVQRYAGLLAGPGTDRGLIGPHEIDRIWERHILNCAVVATLVPDSCTLVDIGSGAGLPGIVLAILRPDLSVVLVDSMLKRSVFLGECVAALGLSNAEVRRGRAEDLAGKRQRGAKDGRAPGQDLVADVVVARAVAPLGRLAEWAVPLVRPGGTILAIKGDRARAELAEAQSILHALGVVRAEILTVGQDKVEDETVVVRIVIGDETGGRSRRERGGRQDLA